MSKEELECPASASDLYLAASPDEVEATRPFMTGDVFSGVLVPGLESSGLAVVLTHPCSMRVDGVELAKRLHMAPVAVFKEAELEEEWMVNAARKGADPIEATRAFHDWIRSSDESGVTRQDQLKEPQRRAGVRREMHRLLRA